jgi:hypothetical protein
MSDSILDGDMAAALTDALMSANVPYALTITRSVPGTPDPTTPWIPGTPTLENYDARGWEENYSGDEIDGTVILSTDMRIVVLAATIAKAAGAPDSAPATIVPAVNDIVTSSGKGYLVIRVTTDPTGATTRLQVRA